MLVPVCETTFALIRSTGKDGQELGVFKSKLAVDSEIELSDKGGPEQKGETSFR